MKLVFEETIRTEIRVTDEFYQKWKDNPEDASMQLEYTSDEKHVIATVTDKETTIKPVWWNL